MVLPYNPRNPGSNTIILTNGYLPFYGYGFYPYGYPCVAPVAFDPNCLYFTANPPPPPRVCTLQRAPTTAQVFANASFVLDPATPAYFRDQANQIAAHNEPMTLLVDGANITNFPDGTNVTRFANGSVVTSGINKTEQNLYAADLFTRLQAQVFNGSLNPASVPPGLLNPNVSQLCSAGTLSAAGVSPTLALLAVAGHLLGKLWGRNR